MDQEAVVVLVEDNQAYVEVGGASAGCGRCHEAGGCQSSILGKLFRTKSQRFRIANGIGAHTGDRVIVRVANGAALRAALLIYAMPVLLLLAGALVGTLYGGGDNKDLAAALGALLGMGFGIIAAFLLRRSPVGRVQEPFLVRRSTTLCISKEASS